MSWKKHFQSVPSGEKLEALMNKMEKEGMGSSSPGFGNKFSSYLPEVYTGNPNRIERYSQYTVMDQDTEINRSLDTIAEFCTQQQENQETLFDITYNKDATETEVEILNDLLKQWTRVNEFRKRIWRVFRNTLMNGDQFFLRDPQTMKWLWIDHSKVEKIIVDESKGKEPDHYVMKDLDLNLQALVATNQMTSPRHSNLPATYTSSPMVQSNITGQAGQMSAQATPRSSQSRFDSSQNSFAIDAQYIVHLSLSEGLDANWPFGNSILEPIFKTYKQKELLEDAIIIYRVQRAPERRVFYIDTGDMPGHRAMAYVERVKNEIHQRRIPNRTGGGSSILDASYNPLCLDLNTRVPLLDGREITIKNLIEEFNEGKENWTYSCDPITGKIVPGNITWAGITRENAKVIKLTFDNDETLICTPDHKIPILGKGFVRADEITEEDSLISFETDEMGVGSSSKDRTYTRVYDHSINDWVYTHRMVGTFFRSINKHQEFTYLEENIGKHKNVIHHKDFDRYNNDPRNLQWMNKDDHIKYHQQTKKEWWDNITDEESNRVKSKIKNTLKEMWRTGNPEKTG